MLWELVFDFCWTIAKQNKLSQGSFSQVKALGDPTEMKRTLFQYWKSYVLCFAFCVVGSSVFHSQKYLLLTSTSTLYPIALQFLI